MSSTSNEAVGLIFEKSFIVVPPVGYVPFASTRPGLRSVRPGVPPEIPHQKFFLHRLARNIGPFIQRLSSAKSFNLRDGNAIADFGLPFHAASDMRTEQAAGDWSAPNWVTIRLRSLQEKRIALFYSGCLTHSGLGRKRKAPSILGRDDCGDLQCLTNPQLLGKLNN